MFASCLFTVCLGITFPTSLKIAPTSATNTATLTSTRHPLSPSLLFFHLLSSSFYLPIDTLNNGNIKWIPENSALVAFTKVPSLLSSTSEEPGSLEGMITRRAQPDSATTYDTQSRFSRCWLSSSRPVLPSESMTGLVCLCQPSTLMQHATCYMLPRANQSKKYPCVRLDNISQWPT